MNGKTTKPQFISVPFKASSPNGIMEYNGIAKFSPAGIVVEYDSKFLGLIGGEVKEVRIALDDILDIKFRRGVYKFFARIHIRLQNLATLNQLPNDDGKAKLKIKREDFDLAERAVEQVLLFINENEKLLSACDNGANEHLPPAQVSVSELFDTEKLDKNKD